MFALLYIPHGSDERYQLLNKQKQDMTSLYPTWFRWKFCYNLHILSPFVLYIPHGSDERNIRIIRRKTIRFLYIPHGSDERRSAEPSARRDWRLYIPHGSDERSDSGQIYILDADFISHMVQMKGRIIIRPKLGNNLYIPHGSDESRFSALEILWCPWPLYIPHGSDESSVMVILSISPVYFISHMVQMKVIIPVVNQNPNTLLYIPHGSDERQALHCTIKNQQSHFISHMVQMKVRCVRVCYSWWDIYLYIPHGSDERKVYYRASNETTALYPTWFRWKGKQHSVIWAWLHPLYPTWFRWKTRWNSGYNYAFSFISHMVQMKARGGR